MALKTVLHKQRTNFLLEEVRLFWPDIGRRRGGRAEPEEREHEKPFAHRRKTHYKEVSRQCAIVRGCALFYEKYPGSGRQNSIEPRGDIFHFFQIPPADFGRGPAA